jgi:sRNA-binding protein
MTTKLFAVVLLALALTACDSTPENTTDANKNAEHPATASPSPGANDQATPAPVPSTSNTPQYKAGDKVKVKTNGSSSDATVVSVDEKLGKVTVKLAGGEEKTVAFSDVTKL